MMDLLTGAVQEILVTVLLAALSLASVYTVSWIRRQQASLQARTDAELLDRTIARAAALVESTVLSIESTIARRLREAVKAGLADRRELEALGRQAVDDVLEHLGAEGRRVLEESVGDLRDFVRDLVEAQVERLKQGALVAITEQVVPNSSGPAAS